MNQPLSRRMFLLATAVTGAGLASRVEAQAMLDEKEGTAAALGYVADAKRVDVKRRPTYVAGQHCGNCMLYKGKPADKAAECQLFAGKKVAAAGWCSAWAKKP